MTSETVVVELSRDEAEQLCDRSARSPEINRAIRRRAESKLREALASDSQGGKGGDAGWSEVLVARDTDGAFEVVAAHGDESQDQRVAAYQQGGHDIRLYVPAPTQPSLSASDREQLERIAEEVLHEYLVRRRGHTYTPPFLARQVTAAFLRHLASAPPEGIGQDVSELVEAYGWLNTGESSPPEPQALEGEGRTQDLAAAICREVSGLSPEVREDVDDVARALAPYIAEHEATVERLEQRLADTRDRHDAESEAAEAAEKRANDLRARLEKAESQWYGGRFEDALGRADRAEAERDRAIEDAKASQAEKAQVEVVLGELAAEFEQEADEVEAAMNAETTEGHIEGFLRRRQFETLRGCAQLLREKQAVLKGTEQ